MKMRSVYKQIGRKAIAIFLVFVFSLALSTSNAEQMVDADSQASGGALATESFTETEMAETDNEDTGNSDDGDKGAASPGGVPASTSEPEQVSEASSYFEPQSEPEDTSVFSGEPEQKPEDVSSSGSKPEPQAEGKPGAEEAASTSQAAEPPEDIPEPTPASEPEEAEAKRDISGMGHLQLLSIGFYPQMDSEELTESTIDCKDSVWLAYRFAATEDVLLADDYIRFLLPPQLMPLVQEGTGYAVSEQPAEETTDTEVFTYSYSKDDSSIQLTMTGAAQDGFAQAVLWLEVKPVDNLLEPGENPIDFFFDDGIPQTSLVVRCPLEQEALEANLPEKMPLAEGGRDLAGTGIMLLDSVDFYDDQWGGLLGNTQVQRGDGIHFAFFFHSLLADPDGDGADSILLDDYISFPLPAQLEFDTDFTGYVYESGMEHQVPENALFHYAYTKTNRMITLTMLKNAVGGFISAEMWFYARLPNDAVYSGINEIPFSFDGTDHPRTVNVTPKNMTLQKYGTIRAPSPLNKINAEITWNISLNNLNCLASELIVTDTLVTGCVLGQDTDGRDIWKVLEYPGGLDVTDQWALTKTGTGENDADRQKLTFTYVGSQPTAKLYTITFTAHATSMLGLRMSGSSLVFANTASLVYRENPSIGRATTQPANANVSVSPYLMTYFTSGMAEPRLTGGKAIAPWVLYANTQSYYLEEPIISIRVPSAQKMILENLRITIRGTSTVCSWGRPGDDADVILVEVVQESSGDTVYRFKISAGEISESYSFSYSTELLEYSEQNDEFWGRNNQMSFVNYAWMEAKNLPIIGTAQYPFGLSPDGPVSGKTTLVSNALSKQALEKNANNQTVSWSISLNSNKAKIEEPVVLCDNISLINRSNNSASSYTHALISLTRTSGSAQYSYSVIEYGSTAWDALGLDEDVGTNNYQAGDQVVVIVFPNGLNNSEEIFRLTTHVAEPTYFLQNNVNTTNIASFYINDEFRQKVSSKPLIYALPNAISKQRVLDGGTTEKIYSEHILPYYISVNNISGSVPLPAGTVIRDKITANGSTQGITYDLDSIELKLIVSEETLQRDIDYMVELENEQTMLITLLKVIDDAFYVYYDIQLGPDCPHFISDTKKTINIYNNARLVVVREDTGDVINITSPQVANSYEFDYMSKTGVHMGDGIVNWEVMINGNGMDYDYSGVTLTDVFTSTAELELDLDSIRLERYTPPKNSNGGHVKLDDIDLEPEHVRYDAESNTFQFTFPQDTYGKYMYKLYYATYTDMSQTGRVKIENNATLGIPYSQSRSATVTFDATGAATSGIPYLRAGLTLQKTDEDGAAIAGVEFVLYNSYSLEVSRGTTNPDGLLTFATARGKPYPLTYNMPYYLEELPREGYITPQDMLEIKILGNRDSASFVADGDISWFKTDAGGAPIDIAYTIDTLGYVQPVLINKPLAHVRMVKTGPAGTPLSGATFAIRDDSDALLATESTDTSGYIDFQDHDGLNMLRGNSYILREVEAPEGYEAYPEDIKLSIAVDGTVSVENSDVEVRFNNADQMWEFVVKNTPLGAPFAFRKVASEATNPPLRGAEFRIYRCVNTNTVHTHEGIAGPAAIDCWQEYTQAVSDENGMVDFGILPNGEYQLVETVSPANYLLPAGQWLIVVDIMAQEAVEITPIPVGGENPPAFFAVAVGGISELRLPNFVSMYSLPETGGTGTEMPQLAGVGLVLLGGLLGILRHRRRKGKNADAWNKIC